MTAINAEQTAPDEVVIFLLLGTLLTLLIAFVNYAIVLVVLSRWIVRVHNTLRMLLFPSASRIKKYTAEYAMGTLITSSKVKKFLVCNFSEYFEEDSDNRFIFIRLVGYGDFGCSRKPREAE